jgi:type IV pilus assembly protein PilY1
MIYGLDVTNPDAPTLLWRKGCPNLDNDDGCSAGFTNFGQSWSTPVGVYAEAYTGDGVDPAPMIVFGGGFDDCLNTDAAVYSCDGTAKGRGIYVLDAFTGELVRYFDTLEPVVTEVAPVDIDRDGFVDLVYAADVAGNVYRISHADLTVDLTGQSDVPPGAVVPRSEETDDEKWEIETIASIPGTTGRFFNSPVAGLFQEQIFVAISSGDRTRPLPTNYPYTHNDVGVQNYLFVLADTPYTDWLDENADPGSYTRRVVNLAGADMFEVGTDLPDGKSLRLDYEGWYLPLPDRGEQGSNPAAIGAGRVLFDSYQPPVEGANVCEQPLGIGKSYAVDLFSPEDEEPVVVNCAGGGFCIPPLIEVIEEVPKGCEDGEECWYEEECPDGLQACLEDPICPEGDVECEACLADPDCVVGPPDICDLPGADCETKIPCIIGGLKVLNCEPDVDPIRGRTFFVEDIDR